MKHFLCLLILLSVYTGAFEQPRRYSDNLFSGVERSTVVYGSNFDLLGKADTLQADIYSPQGDTATNRAMVIFVHGGGFHAGHRNDPAVATACTMLTRKGYVVSSIDYRLGIDRTNIGSLFTALLRAVQDLNAFIRYSKAHANILNIDTNKIFISGASAGGITVLAKAYMKPDSNAARYGVTSMDDLRGKTNDLPNTSEIAGVYSLWGALLDTSWIQSNDVPVGCVQSVNDQLIPWQSGAFMGDSSIILYGSYSIYLRARNMGLFTSVHSFNSTMHDLGLKVPEFRDTTIQLMTDFFSQVIAGIDRADSLENQNRDNTFLGKTYLVQQPTAMRTPLAYCILSGNQDILANRQLPMIRPTNEQNSR